MEMEDYAGKTDRELLIEIHTVTKGVCLVVNDHGKDIEKLKRDSNQAKGALIVIGAGLSLISAKLLGLLKLLGF